MQQLKCENCGSNLVVKGNFCECNYCKATYIINNYKENENSLVVGGELIKYNGNEEVVIIPNSVYKIGKHSFENNLSVKCVVFSKNTNTIDEAAFAGCSNLVLIKNYNSIQFFKKDCFRGAGLAEITIGKNVLEIGDNAFSNMHNLIKVNYFVGKNLRVNGIFSRCRNLQEVLMDKNYFFPSGKTFYQVLNNPDNIRPTFADAFISTPFLEKTKERLISHFKKGVCPECEGMIKKSPLHAKCVNCGIDYLH